MNNITDKNLETFEKIRNEIEDFKNEMNRSFKSLEEQIEERLKEILQQENFKNINSPNIRQKPALGDTYFYINSAGVICKCIWQYDNTDLFRFNIGNCFTTEQEAKDYKENILTKQALKDLALELNQGKKIDWSNCNKNKYYIFIHSMGNSLSTTYTNDYNSVGQIYCYDKMFLTIAIERIGEEKLIKLIESGV